jgi:hypothetical protein
MVAPEKFLLKENYRTKVEGQQDREDWESGHEEKVYGGWLRVGWFERMRVG